jgi:hexosaminidase
MQVSNLTDQYGLNLAAWEDGVMDKGSTPYTRARLLNDHVFAYAWDNVWEWGVANRAYKLANAGYKVRATGLANAGYKVG